MPDWFESALEFSLVALLIVFAALTLISVVVSLIRRLDDRWQQREKAEEAEALEREPSIDTTTLLLIAAAAATMIEGRFYIKKVQRLLPRETFHGPWSMTGRAILHGSHVVGKRSRS